MRLVSVAVTGLLVLVGGGVTSCREVPASPAASAPAPTTAVRTSPRETCRSTRSAVVLTESVMSQPFADVAVTNTGHTSCVLRGYPHLEAWGHDARRSPTRDVRLGIVVDHDIYERIDGGPVQVVLKPRHRAYFSIGTATAYQGGLHLICVTGISVTLPGDHRSQRLGVDLFASRPVGGRIPVGVTALRSAPR